MTRTVQEYDTGKSGGWCCSGGYCMISRARAFPPRPPIIQRSFNVLHTRPVHSRRARPNKFAPPETTHPSPHSSRTQANLSCLWATTPSHRPFRRGTAPVLGPVCENLHSPPRDMANLRKYAQETSPVADCENMHTAKIILSTEYFVFTPQSRRLSARRRDPRRLAKTTPDGA